MGFGLRGTFRAQLRRGLGPILPRPFRNRKARRKIFPLALATYRPGQRLLNLNKVCLRGDAQ